MSREMYRYILLSFKDMLLKGAMNSEVIFYMEINVIVGGIHAEI